MWLESSSLCTVNLKKKFTTVPEISNFSQGVTFLARPVYQQRKMTFTLDENNELTHGCKFFLAE